MSQSWTFTRSMTSSTLTQTSTATTTSHTSSDTKSLSTTSSTRSSITRTITTTQTSSTSSTFSDTSSTSAMEMLHNNSNFTFNESQTSTTEFVLRSLIDSEESDASPDSDESDPADESDAMSMRDNSKADTSKGSPSLSRGLTAVGNSDFTNGFASPASLVNFVNLRGAIAELRGWCQCQGLGKWLLCFTCVVASHALSSSIFVEPLGCCERFTWGLEL